jgi:hypothetical protein
MLLSLLLVQHGLEVPGQQRLDLLDRAGRRQMLEEIVQIRVGLDLIDATSHHQRKQVGARLGAARILAEKPCFSARRKVFDLLLAVIVVDRNFRVMQMPYQLGGQPLPLETVLQLRQQKSKPILIGCVHE